MRCACGKGGRRRIRRRRRRKAKGKAAERVSSVASGSRSCFIVFLAFFWFFFFLFFLFQISPPLTDIKTGSSPHCAGSAHGAEIPVRSRERRWGGGVDCHSRLSPPRPPASSGFQPPACPSRLDHAADHTHDNSHSFLPLSLFPQDRRPIPHTPGARTAKRGVTTQRGKKKKKKKKKKTALGAVLCGSPTPSKNCDVKWSEVSLLEGIMEWSG